MFERNSKMVTDSVEYILEKELAKHWVYQAANISEKIELGYEKDILKHYERIV